MFDDIRFHMGLSVLDGKMGKAFVDNIENPKFAILIKNAKEYEFKIINQEIANRIKQEQFMNITDNYAENGIGYCCFYNNQIIGVASSNIIYKVYLTYYYWVRTYGKAKVLS